MVRTHLTFRSPVSRRRRIGVAAFSGLIATTGAITAGLVAAPSLALAGPSCAGTAGATSTYTANQLGTYVVPAGITQVVATVAGGAGGPGPGNTGGVRGVGSIVTSNLSVTPGDSLSISVGQQGSLGAGGQSGGSASGGGAGSSGQGPAGGGGGASFITDGGTLLIAAGGGGAAGYGVDGSSGGNAASGGQEPAGTIANGGDGQMGGDNESPGGGGGGGSATPGAAGSTQSNYSSFSAASAGSGELGGNGAEWLGTAGGGGGGYAGGGGGGMGIFSGGGGAGSSYGIDDYSLSPNGGDGSVTISDGRPALTSAAAVSLPVQELNTFTVCTSALPMASIVESGALPSGVTFVDNGDGTGSLSGTPALGSEGDYPLTFTADNGDGTDVQNFTLTVSSDDSTVSLTGSPTSSQPGESVTFTAQIDGVPGGVAPTGAITFEDVGGSVGPGCDSAPLSTTAGVTTATCTTSSLESGSDPIEATYGGDTNYAGGPNDNIVYVVATTPVVTLASSSNPSVFGQSVTATATITPPVAGSVQFTVNGTDLGLPQPASSGPVASPPMPDGTLTINDNSIGATFTPTDTTDYTSADAADLDQVVDKDLTITSVVLEPPNLVGVVAARAPGGGTPTGTVTFNVDGTSVGSAPLADGAADLTYSLPTGTNVVSAVYSGDADFTASSGTTVRTDPTITAALTSAHPKTTSGWYRSPVTVHFTCTTHGSVLNGACPAAVTLSKNEGGQSVTRTITATDGGTDTVVVNSISIDRVKPHVALRGVRKHGVYDGIAPTAHCVGTDALSGIDTCRIVTTTSVPSASDVRTVRYVAVATDKAGNTARVGRTVRVLGMFVSAAPFKSGAFDVKVGHDYTVGFVSKTRPRYVDATPANGPRPTPFKNGPLLTYAGHGLWIVRIGITASMSHHALWNIGVKSGGTLYIARVRLP